VRFIDSRDCVIQGCTVADEVPGGQESGASLLELVNCRRITVSACQSLDGVPYGLHAANCSELYVNGCTIRDTRGEPKSTAAVRMEGEGSGNLLLGNIVDAEPRGLRIDENAGVRLVENPLT